MLEGKKARLAAEVSAPLLAPVRRTSERDSSGFVQSLARGLSVIRTFAREGRPLTITEVAGLAGLTRAGARRILLTLESLGYVKLSGRHFAVTPRVMELSRGFQASGSIWSVAEPFLEQLVAEINETASAGALDDLEVVYVLRVRPKRPLHMNIGPGARLPAHISSMGRVLLADLHPRRLESYFRRATLERYTDYTLTRVEEIRAAIAEAAKRGYAKVVGEMDESIIGISVPVRSPEGRVLAALNVSVARARHSERDVETQILPKLQATARSIERTLVVGLK
jgi:IclR family pca regulon transcriptional regulator